MPKFNKRHYEALAHTFQAACPDMQPGTVYEDDVQSRQDMWNDTVQWFADMLQSDNRLFDRSRFIHACQPGSNVRARTAHLKVAS